MKKFDHYVCVVPVSFKLKNEQRRKEIGFDELRIWVTQSTTNNHHFEVFIRSDQGVWLLPHSVIWESFLRFAKWIADKIQNHTQ